MEVMQKFMDAAFSKAYEALAVGEVPVGCVFVYNSEIIASGRNTVNETKNATRHAEINCVDQVLLYCSENGVSHVDVFPNIDVFVTVEPCVMCASALQELNIREIFFGCSNPRFGGCGSVYDVRNNSTWHPPMHAGIRKDEAIRLLKEFYKGENPKAPPHKVKKKRRT